MAAQAPAARRTSRSTVKLAACCDLSVSTGWREDIGVTAVHELYGIDIIPGFVGADIFNTFERSRTAIGCRCYPLVDAVIKPELIGTIYDRRADHIWIFKTRFTCHRPQAK